MSRKFIALFILTATLMLASCISDNIGDSYQDELYIYNEYREPDAPQQLYTLSTREQLEEIGFSREWLDSLVEDGICLINMLNQARFNEFTSRIHDNLPIGPSGEVILERYFGGMHFDDNGVLVVGVLEAAFNHESSAIAIAEMLELGIIIETVQFSYQSIYGTLNALRDIFDSAREAGATGMGLGMHNRVEVWLDPYTNEQKAIFNDFLLQYSIDPAMVAITQAVTDEMRDFRAASVAAAVESHGDQITLVGDVEVSLTGIAFRLENRTNMEFIYGAPWDLAHYVNGSWIPVEHPPGTGGMFWPSIGFSLQAGGIQQYRQEWEWLFGELPPGRYMFIRDGWLGEWSPDGKDVYAVVKFTITEDCPHNLPSEEEIHEFPDIINIIEYSNITPYGMTIVIENASDYDIDHRAQILFMVPERYVTTDYWWEWQQYHLPFLPGGNRVDYFIQGEGFIESGGRLEFTLNWEMVFGLLPPDEYVIALSLGGHAHPPHPTGWAFNDTVMIAFVV
ncbi:MAG: hypothetical protein FWC77_00185 [Defluviitaleaceae bacterium]|nr:hypothetical protein [Defluviitaleaceae bacterium]